MIFKYLLPAILLGMCRSDQDGKKWVWNENNRNSNGRSYVGGAAIQNPNSRYNVFEEINENRPTHYFPNSQPSLGNGRPPPFYENRPPILSSNIQERPGGIYAENIHRPTYGSHQTSFSSVETPGILVGPTPSWVKESPIKNIDKCKCAEKFNCNSPGISYGHCDVGKQYCCYSTRRNLGGPLPSKPVHSIENGILVGPGGPVDRIPGINNYSKPSNQLGSEFYRPGSLQVSQASSGANVYGGRPGAFKEPNEHSLAHGVLIGLGGPYDVPSYGLGRSAKDSPKTDKAK